MLRTRFLLSTLRRHFASFPEHTKLSMPALSPTMEKGNIAKWHKKVGDKISAGEAMAEVETDKASVAWESVDDGYLAKILVPAGTNDIPVGKIAAIIVDSQDAVAKFENYSEEGESKDSDAKSSDKDSDSKKSSDKDSDSKKSSDKDSDSKKSSDKDSDSKKSSDKGSDSKKSSDKGSDSESKDSKTSESKDSKTSDSQDSKSSSSGGRVVASPLARKVANEKGVNLSELKGTGPSGRIIAADVKEAKASGKPAEKAEKGEKAEKAVEKSEKAEKADKAEKPKPATQAPPGAYTDIPHSNVRKIIAQRLTQSKQTIPHYYLSVDVCVDKLLKVRSVFNGKAEKEAKDKSKAAKLSVNDFIIKASALSLRKIPEVNVSWLDTAVRQYNYVDISVAVSTEGGLITPIVKDADLKGLNSISEEVKALAAKARDNKLQPNEFQGGTFTISNLGMFGIKSFAAIINPPQACILAVGTTEARLVPKSGENGVETSQFMTLTLSCDHRVVDGALGARWLAALKGYLEDPLTMLL